MNRVVSALCVIRERVHQPASIRQELQTQTHTNNSADQQPCLLSRRGRNKFNTVIIDEVTNTHTHTHTHTHKHKHRHRHRHRQTYTHTHTHTHMLGFHVLWGLSIDVMVFILYKLYILSPCTAPIPKPNHHRRHSAILHFQKTSLSLIYKLVSSWGPKNVPTRTRILDIAILVGTFCPHNVGFT